jgi:hypothetical protein
LRITFQNFPQASAEFADFKQTAQEVLAGKIGKTKKIYLKWTA